MKKALNLKRALLLLAVLLCITVTALVSCGECEHDYADTVVPATCTAEGYTLHKCKECDEEYKDSFTAKLEHAYTEAVTKAPTCSAEGEKTLACSVCGDSKTEAVAKDPNQHHYVHVQVVDPTCESDGYTSRTCECGHNVKDTPTLATGHSYTSVVTEPTCEARGYTTHTCTCGESYVDSYTQKENHSYDTVVVTKPTCLAGGYTTHTCICGDSYVDTYTPIAEHDWDDGEVTVTATCQVAGEITYTCKTPGCEESKPVNTGKLKHSYDTVAVTEPTCTEPGYTTHTCSCGASYQDGETPANGHVYATTPDQTVAATCEDDGYEIYPCTGTDCHEIKTVTLLHSGHNTEGQTTTEYDRVATGNACEYTIYYRTPCNNDNCEGVVSEETKALHKYYWKITDYATCNQDGYKTHICSECQQNNPDAEPQSYSDENAHSWDEGSTVGGVTTFTCLNGCGHTKTTLVYSGTEAAVDTEALKNTGSVAIDGAEFEFDSGVTDALTGENVTVSAGTVDDSKRAEILASAGKSEEDIRNAPIYNFLLKDGDTELHELGGYVTVTLPYELPDGEDANNIQVWYVDENGELQYYDAVYSNGYAIFETDHFSHYIVVRYTPEQMCEMYGCMYDNNGNGVTYNATCIRDEFTIKTCLRCGEAVRIEGRKAYGHDFDTEIIPATCFEEGYTVYTCCRGNCGYTYVSDYTEKLEHSWDNGTAVPATCAVKGHTLYTCLNECGSTYTDNYTDFADHKWNSGTYTKAPSCTTSGISHHVCTVCLDEKDEYVPTLGHSYSEKTVTATCTEKGYVLHSCTRCDDSYKDTYTPVAPHSWKNGVCSVCEAACSHVLGTYAYNNDATCTENGTESAACIECGTVSTREKVGTAKGHDYQNGICRSCGDGCAHSWGEFTDNNDATCTENGTKSHTCNNCGVTEKVTVPDSAKGHSYEAGVCQSCGEECEHSIVAGVCTECGYAVTSFYSNLISSIFNSDSFVIDINDVSVLNAWVDGTGLDYSDMKGSGKMSLEFDEDGDPVVMVVAEMSCIENGVPMDMTVEMTVVDGVMYMKECYDYGTKTETNYDVSIANGIEILSYIFGKKDMVEGEGYEMASAAAMLASIGSLDFDLIGEPMEALLDMLLKRVKTENGYEISLDFEKLKELNDDLRDEKAEVIIDRILGEGAFDQLLDYVVAAMDKTAYRVICDIKDYLVSEGKITAADFDSMIESMLGEDIEQLEEELSDVILGELIIKNAEIDSVAELKAMIEYYADRISELSVYELIEMMTSGGGELELWDTVNSFLENYSDQISFKIYTDKDGNLISIDLGVDTKSCDYSLNEVKLEGTVTRNATMDHDFSELLNRYPNVDITLKGAPESITELYSLVTENGKTYLVKTEIFSDTTAQFGGSYNGKACVVSYDTDYITEYRYEIRLVTAEDYCYVYDYENQSAINLSDYDEYDVYTYFEGSITTDKLYARYYDSETGELLYEQYLGENSGNKESGGYSGRYVFIYDSETGDLLMINRGSVCGHTFDYDEGECGDIYTYGNVCISCGEEKVNTDVSVKEHSYHFVATLPNDAESCDDAVVTVVCSDCEQEAKDLPESIIENLYSGGHSYVEERYDNYVVIGCTACGEGYIEVYSYGNREYYSYFDENGSYHEVEYYYYNYGYGGDEKGDGTSVDLVFKEIVAAKDIYTVVDSDGNATEYVDYYGSPRFDESMGAYTYSVKVSTTTDIGHQHVFKEADPKTTQTENGDGTVTVKNSAIAVCSCGETMEYRDECVVDMSAGVVYSEYSAEIVNGEVVYCESYEYVYISGEQYVVSSEYYEDGRQQKMENLYDELGRVISQTVEYVQGKIGMVTIQTYSYSEQGQTLTSEQNKMLYNGKLLNWTKNAYTYSGCGSTTVFEVLNPDGSLAFTKTTVVEHTYTEKTYELAENSTSCEDGVLVTEVCMVCGETVGSYVESFYHEDDEVCSTEYYDYGRFGIEVQSCLCGVVSDIWYNGEYTHVCNEWIYDENGNELEVIIMSDPDLYAFVIEVTESELVEGACYMRRTTTLYEAYGVENYEQFFVYDGESGQLCGLDLDIASVVTSIVSYGYGYHDISETQTESTSTDANGNTVITTTVKSTCKNCDAIKYTEITVSVYDDEENLISESCTRTDDVTGEVMESYTTEIISENVIRTTSEMYGTVYVYTVYMYGCGSITICEMTDHSGYKNIRYANYNESHEWHEVYELADPDSTSCEDGVLCVNRCAVCGAVGDKYPMESWHNGRLVNEQIWSDESTGCSVVKLSCVCGKEFSYECLGSYSSEWLEIEGGERCVYTFTDYEGNVIYCFVADDVSVYSQCHVTRYNNYYAGASLEAIEPLASVIVEDYDDHDIGYEENSESGVNGSNTTQIVTNTARCTQCDYSEITTEYYEYDESGSLVIYTKTETVDGENVYTQRVEYVYDELGTGYESLREVKDIRDGVWYKTVNVYDFENCMYVCTEIFYSLEDGSVIKERTYDCDCHIGGDAIHTLLPESESCYDGVEVIVYCRRCEGVIENNIINYHERFLKDTFKAESECGLVVNHYGCACGLESYVEITGCEFNLLEGTSTDNGYVDTYRCFVTSCAYTYTVHTYSVYVPEECMRYHYVEYFFGAEVNQITADGCDYSIKVLSGKDEYHDWMQQMLDENGSYRNYCTQCGLVEAEYYYDELGRLVRKISTSGEYTIEEVYSYYGDTFEMSSEIFTRYYNSYVEYVKTLEYDEYGRITLEREDNYDEYGESIYWSQYRYEYVADPNYPTCCYWRYCTYEDATSKGNTVEEYFEDHIIGSYYLDYSCTQYNAEVYYCSRCDYTYNTEWGAPTEHIYEPVMEGDEIVTYCCTTCGMTNDTGVNGYFILEDLSDKYGIPAVGIYFPGLSERVDWNVNFRITISDGEQTRQESLTNLSYTALYVYSSGTIIVDSEAYSNAINELLGEGETVTEFVFAFSILDQDSETYLSHELILDMAEM